MIIHFIYISRLIARRLIKMASAHRTSTDWNDTDWSLCNQAVQKLGNQQSTASQSPDSVNYTNSNNNNEDTKTSLISSSHMTSQLTKY